MISSVALAPSKSGLSLYCRRIFALFLRVYYLHVGSWPRVIEMFYWPTLNMLIWGFTSQYIARETGSTSTIGKLLLSGILLTEVMLRVEIGTMMLFMEEIWSRNLGHLFASPLGTRDYLTGIFSLSFGRMVAAVLLAVVFAYYLFGFALWNLGWPLLGYVGLLVMNGWWCGLLLVALLVRYGLSAEWLAWMSTWLIIPLVAPYYPVSVLPLPVQWVAHALPATYVFESVKSVLKGGEVLTHGLWIALGLNLIYFALACGIFHLAYQGARRRGSLLQMGE